MYILQYPFLLIEHCQALEGVQPMYNNPIKWIGVINFARWKQNMLKKMIKINVRGVNSRSKASNKQKNEEDIMRKISIVILSNYVYYKL